MWTCSVKQCGAYNGEPAVWNLQRGACSVDLQGGAASVWVGSVEHWKQEGSACDWTAGDWTLHPQLRWSAVTCAILPSLPKRSHIVFDTSNDTFQLINMFDTHQWDFQLFMMSKYRYLDGMLKMWYIFDRQVFLQFKSSISLKPRAADFFFAGNFSPFQSSCCLHIQRFLDQQLFPHLK